MPPRGPTPPPGGNPNCRMQPTVIHMQSSGPQHPGHMGPPQPQIHPGAIMMSVGASSGGIPGGLSGIHYGPHGPLPPGGPIPDRPDHGISQMPPGQQSQMGGTMLQQHHHGPPPQPGVMAGVPPMPPHQQMAPGPLPPHNHPHHLHHPPHGPLPIHRGGFQPEYRIYELNKRLQQRADESDSQWWEAFAVDFFDDDATITITVRFEDGPKHFNIGRTLIPRYFRSIFESGCNELYFNLRHTKESFHNPLLTLDSDCASMVMNMSRPFPSHVIVDAQFTLGFTLDELMRIRNWTFQIRSHRELIMRSMLGVQDPMVYDQISKNVTRTGIPANTLHFLRLCVILEPMQELMSRQKFQNISPRDCLRNIVMNRWKRMSTVPTQPTKAETNRQTNKRRKRKGSSANSEAGGGRATKRKQSPVSLPPQSLAQPGDILIVGEPTLMGGEFGEDDERMITRLENSQYDPAAVAAMAAAQQQQQQQMNAAVAAAAMGQPQHHPATSGGNMSPFGRSPSFPPPPPPAFPPGGVATSSPGMMYGPPPLSQPGGGAPPASCSPSSTITGMMKPHQSSPLYGHPNSVPQQQTIQQQFYGAGPGAPMMPASVPPPHHTGGRIMSPMGGGPGGMGNPSTPIGQGNASMMFAPPPSLADSEPGGFIGSMGSQQQAQHQQQAAPPPRSSSTSSINTAGLVGPPLVGSAGAPLPPPAFPPPPPPSASSATCAATEGVTPPPPALQQQQNGPLGNSPATGSQFPAPPPPLSLSASSSGTVFDSSGNGGRAPTPRHQPAADGSGPGSIGMSEASNPNGFVSGEGTGPPPGTLVTTTSIGLDSSPSVGTSANGGGGPGAPVTPTPLGAACQDALQQPYVLPDHLTQLLPPPPPSLVPSEGNADAEGALVDLPSSQAPPQPPKLVPNHEVVDCGSGEQASNSAPALQSSEETPSTTANAAAAES